MRCSILCDKCLLLLLAMALLSASPRACAQSATRSQAQPQAQDQYPEQVQAPEQYQQQSPGNEPDRIQDEGRIGSRDQIQGATPFNNAPGSQARIVRISYIDGEVRIDHGDGYESATMNVPVTENNWVQTRSDGWAEVQMEDGSLIRMAPDTVIAFTDLRRLASGGTVTTVDLDQGEAEFKIAKRDENEFQVTVKNKSIVLDHSSSFRVTSTNADPLEIAVSKGEVSVRDPESGGEVAVKKNETFALDPTDVAQYALDKGAEADQLDDWSKQRDEALSTYASASHGAFQSPYQYGTGDLNYYGDYFDAPGYGMVWQPNGVNLGWNPFMNGYWVFSPGFGYTWVSSYPWGWLPFRYGNWVYINNRGWCWAPGGWTRWNTGPRWVNAPPGFRPPAPPPANGTVVVGGSPGRVVRPANPWDRGGAHLGGRVADRDDNAGSRTNRRVLTNEDIESRVPRTDIPATQSSTSGGNGSNHSANGGEQHPAPKGAVHSWPDRQQRLPETDRNAGNSAVVGSTRPAEVPRVERPAEVPHTERTAPAMPQQATPPAQPTRPQYTPPPAPAVHQPAPPAVHQSAPAAAPAPRSFSPPAPVSHSSGGEGSHGGGRPR
jgi:hypothetical protein